MPPAVAIAAVGTAVAIGGTVASISAQKKAAKANQKQFAAQRSMDNLRAARERTQAIRAARLSRGESQQAAVNQGAENTSASLGALGSIDSQLKSNLSFLDQYNTLSDQATLQAGKVAKYQSQASIAGQVAGIGVQVAQASGGLPGLSEMVFGKGK